MTLAIINRLHYKLLVLALLSFLGATRTIMAIGETTHPIDVGSNKQLLFDPRFLEESSGVKLQMNRPFQDPEPVLVADQPWELSLSGHHTVMFDQGKFRMWYNAIGSRKRDGESATRVQCYAESTDGVHWQKPDLQLIEYDGNAHNNIVYPSDPRAAVNGASIFRDEHAAEAERYKSWYKFYPSKEQAAHGIKRGTYASVSPDGLRWKRLGPDRGYPLSRGQASDSQNICFWDADLEKYIGFVRKKRMGPPPRDRTCWVGLMTSDDFENWTMAEDIFRADEQFKIPGGKADWLPPVDLYAPGGMKVPGVPNAYILLPTNYYHWESDQSPATIDVGLATSRDLIHWWQPAPANREPFLRLGPDDSAHAGMLFAFPWPIVVENEIWTYFSATNRFHNGKQKLPTKSGIFRARLRRDGFVSVDAGYRGGEFTTPVLAFEGGRLELSLDGSAGGWLQVEIQSPDGTPIDGYGINDCDTIRGNSFTKTITWRGLSDMSRLAHTPIRLRFVMRSMKLFAFQFRESTDDD